MMPLMGIRELSRNVSEAIGRVEAGDTVIITRRGRPTAVMLPLHAARVEALTTAAARALVQQLDQAMQQLEAGEGNSLDELLSEAREAERAERRVRQSRAFAVSVEEEDSAEVEAPGESASGTSAAYE